VLNVWSLQVNTHASGNPIRPLNHQESEFTVARVEEVLSYITLFKLAEPPDVYVELTEEELEQFPALQAALQPFEGSERTEYWHKTTEQEATSAYNYLLNKFEAACEASCRWNAKFQYRTDFYLYGIAVAGGATTTVSEVSIAARSVFRLGAVFFALYVYGMKQRKHK